MSPSRTAAQPKDGRGGPAAAAVVLLAGAGAAILAAAHASGRTEGALSVTASLLVPAVAAWSVMRRRPRTFTTADGVTLLRVAIVGVLTAALVLAAAGTLPPRTWTVLILAAAAALLDAVDGWAARRLGRGSEEGAHLDAESDAAALLVLSGLLSLTVGWWVLAIGLTRYAFAAGTWLRPLWRRTLPYSGFRRTAAAVQATAVVIGLGPVVPQGLAAALAGGALTLLLISFGRDIILLERDGREPPAARRPEGAT
ncbi:CDP-alcohol phosphatidyltransferase family protein [Nesterenkonia sp. NBAIMH1]|uniref:CDP-alcohol phosphatidyltransferase family protein n=1 Tax=Nesterenkonia sp. NBAIMH1 TaxID=2600320 RepID=UPI0011B80D98|nr:CDP-alcohol phosphatidyltransferase family protein [Nesterenkonia sp. NBAIMH1]